MRTSVVGSIVIGIGYMLMVDAVCIIGFALLFVGLVSLYLRIRSMQAKLDTTVPEQVSVVELVSEALDLFEQSTEVIYKANSVEFTLRDGSVVSLDRRGVRHLEAQTRRRRKSAPRIMQPAYDGPPPLSDEELERMYA